jgi:anaerobic selenocysteine-containing dehydrogenase
MLSPQMLVEPGEEVLILPATTRYEVPGGVTETSTERRIIFSPEIPGPRVDEARPEWEVISELAARVRPVLRERVTFRDTAAVREEIAQVVPLYRGIETLREQGDQVQYGGRRLCEGWDFPTPDGRARFNVVEPPEEEPLPEGSLRLVTRRGKQFNSIVHERRDAITGAERDAVLVSVDDAAKLALADGDRVAVASDRGRLEGRVLLAPVKPGTVQVHWPEGNVLIAPDRRSPDAGIPDYTAGVRLEKWAAGS